MRCLMHRKKICLTSFFRSIKCAFVAAHQKYPEAINSSLFAPKESPMSSYQEQFSVATRAQIESQLNLFSVLFSKTFEGVEKVVGLNLAAAKASLEESNAAV